MQITVRGTFSLGESQRFGFGQRAASSAQDEVMRLAFVLDGYEQAVGAAVRQRPDGDLDVDVVGPPPTAPALEQVARVLSVDVDAAPYDVLLDSDPVLAPLALRRPGLRPPLFHSAYEAAIWAVLSSRLRQPQAARLRTDLSSAHGTTVRVAGTAMPVVPTPRQLLRVRSFPAVTPERLERMHGVARAALDGRLDTAALRMLDPAEAAARLRQLPGIGPFYSELVVIRALGHTDAVPTAEPRLLALAGELFGAGRPLEPAELHTRVAPWSPWRTWACVLIRASAAAVVPGPVRVPRRPRSALATAAQASATRSA